MALKRGMKNLLGVEDIDINEASNNTTDNKKDNVKVVKQVKEVIKEVPAETKLKVSEIEPNTLQPRKEFNEDALAELADSIKKFGIIEPIVVSKKGKGYPCRIKRSSRNNT